MMCRKLLALSLLLTLPLLLTAGKPGGFTRKLVHKDVRSILSRVTEELGPEGEVWVDRAQNRITVRDDGKRLAAIRTLILALDVPPRHFAVTSSLDLFPSRRTNPLFTPVPAFVDMTRWTRERKPLTSYMCLADLYEGSNATCALGPSHRVTMTAEGYDPSRGRLALKRLVLTRSGNKEAKAVALIDGRAVLPEGTPTLFLIEGNGKAPLVRLSVLPTLVPDLSRPEVP